jgi:SM-20-related protein
VDDHHTARTPSAIAQAARALSGPGWHVVDDWLDAEACRGLALACGESDDLQPASIGRGDARVHDPAVRGDRTRWLDGAHAAEADFLARLDALRMALNERLFLGLQHAEAHFAVYPPGAGYARHRDRFRDDDARVVSAVCYLNEDWEAAHGGALRLFLPGGPHDVLPVRGRLVLFLSAEIEHEVLPASRERRSIAAWLRRR